MARHVDFHVPLDVLITPRSGECVVDSWWMVHPEHGVSFTVDMWESSMSRRPIPWTNYDRRIVERFLKNGHEAKQINVAFISQAYVYMKEAIEAEKLRKAG